MKRIALVILCLVCAGVPAAAQHPAHPELVGAVKADLQAKGVDLSGPCGAFAITKRVAWALKSEGIGLLSKPGGNNCEAFATDFLVYQDGVGVDILGDGGGLNTPAWQADFDAALLGRWREPLNPDGLSTPPPVVTPGPAPVFSDPEIIRRLAVIENLGLQNLAETKAARTDIQETGGALKDAMVFIGKYILPSIGTALATWQVAK